MSRCRSVHQCLVILAGSLLASVASAENADMPYAELCRMQGIRFHQHDGSRPTEVVFTTSSTRPDVRPNDIRLVLHVGDDRLPISVAEDGRVAIPVNEQWALADAVIVSNQPRGTLKLSIGFKLSEKVTLEELSGNVSERLEGGRIRYQDLVQLARDRQAALIDRAIDEKFAPDDAWMVKAGHDLQRLDEEFQEGALLLWDSENPDSATARFEESPSRPFRMLGNRVGKLIGKKDSIRAVAPGKFVIDHSEALFEFNPVLKLSESKSWRCLFLPDTSADELEATSAPKADP